MTELTVELHFDDNLDEGNWEDYLTSTTGNGPDGRSCLGLLYLHEMMDLNLYMFEVDMFNDFGDKGWKHLQTKVTTSLSANEEQILRFPVFQLTFVLHQGDLSAFRTALNEHLRMAELALGSRSDTVSIEAWKIILEEFRKVGLDWGGVEGVIYVNPTVVV